MRRYLPGLLLVSPALAIIVFLFLVPLGGAVTGAFQDPDGGFSFGNFFKTYQLYSTDIIFTIVIVALSAILTAAFSVAIAGYLTLCNSPVAVAILRWLYRWPLFIPFIVVGQILRTFLAKNGLMNNIFVATGLITPLHTVGFLDWRGVVIAFVWKQTPFVTLLLAGAMASIDRGTIEAARNLGASRLRILLEIVLPQAAPTLMVGLTLSVVTMMSVLSVPLMIASQSPTVITVDMAFRINAYGDYGVANALGLVSLLLTGAVAWIYLRQTMRENVR
ncbi:ABC transporter permease [Mesorhizobium koreense]|uniref:ABC transporter permease n=1 Tax=Mesorhizobium koreense TaxID=3074855 RepID=UPI00287B8B1D|nr:ABC transporter permease subunit [Mesorhizobium sp. WR6]